jgi:hypothetical protein
MFIGVTNLTLGQEPGCATFLPVKAGLHYAASVIRPLLTKAFATIEVT